MELVHGHNLRKLLVGLQPLPLKKLLGIAGQMAEGLATRMPRELFTAT